jgi:MOSC domain-containing protein YiiM
MKIISTNISSGHTFLFGKKNIQSGIFKKSKSSGIFLTFNGVNKDTVADTKNHGGPDKACYLFSHHHYKYWKQLYPKLVWEYGMFGENITVDYFDENKINIGDVFKIGESKIQVTQPRQPCFKLGYKFKDPKIIPLFQKYSSPGFYARVLKEGLILPNSQMEHRHLKSAISINETFQLLYGAEAKPASVKKALSSKYLAPSCKKDILKRWPQ